MFGRATVVLLTGTLLAASQPPASGPLTPTEAQRLAEKLEQVIDHDARSAGTSQTLVLPAREVNAYLKFQGATLFPAGITDPHLTFGGDGQVAARAIVDLDAVSKERDRGLFDPLAYLGGDLVVTAEGSLETADGLGQVAVDAATVGGVPVPRTVLNELVRYYTRNAERPDGVDLNEPFELPYGIHEVVVDTDQATVVQ